MNEQNTPIVRRGAACAPSTDQLQNKLNAKGRKLGRKIVRSLERLDPTRTKLTARRMQSKLHCYTCQPELWAIALKEVTPDTGWCVAAGGRVFVRVTQQATGTQA